MNFGYKEYSLVDLLKVKVGGLIILLWFSVSLYGQKGAGNIPFVVPEGRRAISGDTFPKQAQPLSAGYTVNVQEDIEKAGRWETGGPQRVWLIGFHVPGARGLNAYMSDLRMQDGDSLFIYTYADGPKIICTKKENSPYFGFGFLPGDSLVIELHTTHRNIPFRITEIGIAEQPTGEDGRNFGGAGGCEVLVNCEEGDHYQSEKKGVARILIKEATNLFWCTGSLVNNTNNDGTPYFLTANHCGQYASGTDYNLWLFYFNYEADGCIFPDTEPDNSQKMLGAKLLAHSPYDVDKSADFKLLLLNHDVPDAYGVYYNGWNRSGTVSSAGVTMHHPQGDIKMISTYEVPVVSTDYSGSVPNENGRYWKVNWAETKNGHGVTEGGSSGSPLFDQNGYIIGTLTGGEASCSYPDNPDYYGKFSYAWESEGADSARQLKYWLDPLNTGVLSLKGTNLDTLSALANFSSDVLEISMGEQVHYVNYSTGNITGYEWYFDGGDPSYSEAETPPPVQYNTFGAFGVTLIARSDNGNDTLYRPAYINVLPLMVPNPSANGVYRLTFGKQLPEHIEMSVYDMLGRKIGPVFITEEKNSLFIDLSRHAAGLYLIHVQTDERLQIVKAFYVKR